MGKAKGPPLRGRTKILGVSGRVARERTGLTLIAFGGLDDWDQMWKPRLERPLSSRRVKWKNEEGMKEFLRCWGFKGTCSELKKKVVNGFNLKKELKPLFKKKNNLNLQ